MYYILRMIWLMLFTIAVTPFASANYSANVGYVTDYYFRGIGLGDAGAYIGADYEQSGFYAGTWIIDDGNAANDGLETDFYLGYKFVTGPVELGLAYTLYEYTYTADSEAELSLSATAGPFSIAFASGEDQQVSGDFDYDYLSISLSRGNHSITYGDYRNDGTDMSAMVSVPSGSQDYQHWQLSTSTELAGLSMSLSAGAVSNDNIDGDDGYIFLDINKSFDL